jgi:superfamily II DNA or RNA helicase
MPERAEGDKGAAPNNTGSDKSAGVPPIDSGCPIEVNSIAHYTVCTICNCGVPPNANRIGRHLRESHSSIYRTKELKNIVAGIVSQLNKLPKSDLPDLYNPPKSTPGANIDHECQREHPQLPSIEHLPIVAAACCPHPGCHFLHSKVATLKQHFFKHNVSKTTFSNPLPTFNIKAQSLRNGNMSHFFAVEVSAAPATERPQDGSPAYFLELLLTDSLPSGSNDVTANERHVSDFANEARVETFLQSTGVSWEHAIFLVKDKGSEQAQTRATQALRKYMDAAYDVSCRRPVLAKHKIQGEDCKLNLQDSTIQQYAREVLPLLFFMTKAEPGTGSPASHAGRIDAGIHADLIDMLNNPIRKQPKDELLVIHRVFWHALLDPIDEESSAVPRFLACRSVKEDVFGDRHRLATAKEVSHCFAALKYMLRVVCAAAAYIYAKPNGHSTEQVWKVIYERLSPTHDNGASCVEHMMAIALRVMPSEVTDFRFFTCPDDDHDGQRCAYVDNIHFSCETLSSCVRSIQAELAALLDDLLGPDHTPAAFYEKCADFKDNQRDLRPGHSFASHPQNSDTTAFWARQSLRRCMMRLCDNNDQPRPDQMKIFWAGCLRARYLLLTLLQVTSGGTGRMTELETYQFCNTPQAQRHVFLVGGMVKLVATYSKNRSMHGGRGTPVVRCPDSYTAGLLLRIFLLLVPVEAAFAGIDAKNTTFGEGLDGRKQSAKHYAMMFSRRGGAAIGSDALRSNFQRIMTEHGIPMNTNQYRHLQIGVLKRFGPRTAAVTSDEWAVAHTQSGHSSATGHSIYAPNEAEFKCITDKDVDALSAISAAWHTGILGLSSGFPSDERPPVTRAREPPYASVVAGEVDYDILARAIAREVSSNMELAVGRNEANNVKRRKNISCVGDADTSVILGYARDLLGLNVKTFSSPEQENALRFALGHGKDMAMIAVLPTGAGKSLTYMLPAALADDTSVVVLFVPLVVLVEEAIKKCRDAGIGAVTWNDRQLAGARIVVTSFEVISQNCGRVYESFVRLKAAARKLALIAVDEAHVVVTSSHYRPVMNELVNHLLPKGVETRVRVLALTATAPPSLVPRILGQLGITGACQVRTLSCRPNLEYRVDEVKSGDAQTLRAKEAIKFVLEKHGSSQPRIIVYLQYKSSVDEWVKMMTEEIGDGATVVGFHSSMSEKLRLESLEVFQSTKSERAVIVFATACFGMGVHHANVRLVIHVGMPSTIVEYDQGAGRAGRDGSPATCLAIVRSGRPVSHVPVDLHSAMPRSLVQKCGDPETYVDNRGVCRRQLLSAVLDEVQVAMGSFTCDAISGAVLCDACVRIFKDFEANPGSPPELAAAASAVSDGEANITTSPATPTAPFAQHPAPVAQQPLRFWPRHVVQSGGASPRSHAETLAHAPITPVLAPVVVHPVATAKARQRAEVQHMCSIAHDMSQYCVPCSVRHGKRLQHGATYRNCQMRFCCLRCGSRAHGARACVVLPSPDRALGRCSGCTLRFHMGDVCHVDVVKFGYTGCLLSRLMRFALECYRDKDMWDKIASHGVCEDVVLHCENDLVDWLRGQGQHGPAGLVAFARTLDVVLP